MTVFRAADTASRTDVGRARRGNEDSSLARAPLFVVADGMGGAQAGEVASSLAIQAFEQGLPDDGSAEERLAVVVQRANRDIHEKANEASERRGMGTTVTAALLDDDRLAIAHVGDSRAYLLRGGTLTRLTEDHSLVEELRRKGRLTEEEALEHPQRSIITRALGPEPTVAVDTWTYPVQADDVLLLCSDGLTSMIPESRVRDTLMGTADLNVAAGRLVDEANAAGGRDNITVVLFRVERIDGAGAAAMDSVEQPTMIVGASSPVASASRTFAGPQAGARGGAGVTPGDAGASPGGAGAATVGRAPLAQTQGFGTEAPAQRHFGWLGKTVAGLVALGFVIFLVGGGGYLATRQLYFLGTNHQGTLVVYRGLPYVAPFGIPLYETFYVSGVPASELPADRRGTLLNHDLRSQNSATKLINEIERGDITG